jgi:hypothetical protein
VRTRAVIVLVAAAAAAAFDAGAQTPAQDALTYEPSFFAAYEPQTALDMVRRVPGFSLSEGEERRGFAASAGNVLIDGVAPAAKSEELEEILERIPAGDVVRLELIRGAGTNASSAQAVRLNVVRRPSDGEGVWQSSLSRADDGRATPAGQLAWTGRRGVVEYGLAGAFEISHTPIDGVERAFDTSGALDEIARERIVEDQEEGRLSGDVESPLWGGEMSFNGAISREDEHERQLVRVFDAAETFDESETVIARDIEKIAELGVTHRRIMGDWSLELGALATRRWLTEDEEAVERDASGAFDEAERASRAVTSGESIARVSAEREYTNEMRLSLSGEIAFNTLEQDFILTQDDGSGPVIVPTPAANARIEEWRGEFSASVSWRPAPRWGIEAASAYEMSQLDQSGDVDASASLSFLKPSLQITRAVGDDHQLRLRFYRDVGQLDFEDFAASAELESSIVDAGNPDLRPETSWRAEAAGDFRFEEAAIGLTAYAWLIEDALDFVPVGPPGAQFDARGNIGDATLYGLKATFETPAPFIANASLRGEGVWQESEATDPLTGQTRPQSEIVESSLVLEFRHDVPAWGISWGVEFERERLTPEFRLDRITYERDVDDVELWIETRLAGAKLRAFAESFAGARAERNRSLFNADRLGTFDGTETRVRDYGHVFGIEMQGSF